MGGGGKRREGDKEMDRERDGEGDEEGEVGLEERKRGERKV